MIMVIIEDDHDNNDDVDVDGSCGAAEQADTVSSTICGSRFHCTKE